MRRLFGLYAFIAVMLGMGMAFPENYYVSVVGTTAFFHIILAVALNLFMGFAGQISLGHAAFFGIGAYTSAILTTRFGFDPLPAMTAGAIITGMLSIVLARPILKLKGHYLAMATLGLGIIVHIFLVQEEQLTGGPDGLGGIPPLTFFAYKLEKDIHWYFFLGALCAFTIWMSLNLVKSRMGRALKAIHGSEIAAEVLGIDTSTTKAQVFVLSAVITSITGSLFVHQQAFISPDSCSFAFSVELVTMVVLGGLGSTFGAVCGAAILTYLPEFLVHFEELEVLLYGAVLMGTMIFLPKGVFVSIAEIASSLTHRRPGKNGASP